MARKSYLKFVPRVVMPVTELSSHDRQPWGSRRGSNLEGAAPAASSRVAVPREEICGLVPEPISTNPRRGSVRRASLDRGVPAHFFSRPQPQVASGAVLSESQKSWVRRLAETGSKARFPGPSRKVRICKKLQMRTFPSPKTLALGCGPHLSFQPHRWNSSPSQRSGSSASPTSRKGSDGAVRPSMPRLIRSRPLSIPTFLAPCTGASQWVSWNTRWIATSQS